jgi:hypothetical protein
MQPVRFTLLTSGWCGRLDNNQVSLRWSAIHPDRFAMFASTGAGDDRGHF